MFIATKDEAYVLLETILDNTTDGDKRAIAKNYIVQVAQDKVNMEHVGAFIDETLKEMASTIELKEA